MPKPERFVFVCTNQRPPGHPRGSCGQKGAREVIARLDKLFQEKDLYSRIRLVPTGCLGPCMEGPIVAVYPDDVWYKELTPDDVEEIVNQHLIEGNPVERLVLKEQDWD